MSPSGNTLQKCSPGYRHRYKAASFHPHRLSQSGSFRVICASLYSPLPPLWESTNHYSTSLILSLQDDYINGIVPYVNFQHWAFFTPHTFLEICSGRCTYPRPSFMAEEYLRYDIAQFNHSPVQGHGLGCSLIT